MNICADRREPRVETIPDYNPRGRSKEEMKQLESHFAFLKGQWKWHGAVLGKDGVLYGIPSNADKVPAPEFLRLEDCDPCVIV